jgi:hypothetical protein
VITSESRCGGRIFAERAGRIALHHLGVLLVGAGRQLGQPA